MSDMIPAKPDHQCLFAIASEQHGYFTAAQARVCGINWDLLTNGSKRGRYIRIRRGLYRLRDYPSSPREEVVAAWLAVGKDVAVVSHDSALDLLGLSDVIPEAVHLSVPRSKRNLPDLSGVKIHTTTRRLGPTDVNVRDGIRVTSPARTIVDAAEIGTGPEQIEAAIHQALQRRLTTRTRLEQAVNGRSHRVRSLIDNALAREA
jgi:predicted transcriptional regulator of viral defense system